MRMRVFEIVKESRDKLREKIEEQESFKRIVEHNGERKEVVLRYFLYVWEDAVFGEFMNDFTKGRIAMNWILETKMFEIAKDIMAYVELLENVIGSEIKSEIRKMLGA